MYKKEVIAEVTPEEAAALSEFRPCGDVYIVLPMVKAVTEHLSKEHGEVFEGFLYAAIWNAGRVAGIRSERARRHASQTVGNENIRGGQ